LPVTVILKRFPKVGVTGELKSILHDLRQLATSQRGCISGQTLLPTFNGCSTLVVPRWMLLQLWQQYENCPERLALVDRLKPLLNEPASSEVYLESKRVDSVIEKGSSDKEISAGEDSPSQQPAIDWKQPLLVRYFRPLFGVKLARKV